MKQTTDHKELDDLIRAMLLRGDMVDYNQDNTIYNLGIMYGIYSSENGKLIIANRIFETILYNHYLSTEKMFGYLLNEAYDLKNQFLRRKCLNLDLVMRKFQLYFSEIYNGRNDKFLEENGREIFLI